MADKHGHWIPVDPDGRDYTDDFECSVCKKETYLSYYVKVCDYAYCPWCGIKMDEEDSDAAE